MSQGLYTSVGKSTGPDAARRLVRIVNGPLATIYCCPFCKHHAVMRKGLHGVGRGYGLRMGGTLSSQVAAHIRATHPDYKLHYALQKERAAALSKSEQKP